jgi:deazaflavin-dependent oxidoreductase (nitroreductase family)
MATLIRVFLWLNINLYRLTNGIIGGHLGSASVLLLTTTGRKSGKPRTTPLRYLRHNDGYMIAASNWGKENPPAWFYNLQANPTVAFQIMGKHMTAHAEIASNEQHGSLYQQFIDADKRFIDYPKTARRTIPVILLNPQR